jgi:hypothetical protein
MAQIETIGAAGIYLLLTAFLLFAPAGGEMQADLVVDSSYAGRFVVEHGDQTVTIFDAGGVRVAEAERSRYRPETYLVYAGSSQVPRVAVMTPVRRQAFVNGGFPPPGSRRGELLIPVDTATVELSPDPGNEDGTAADAASTGSEEQSIRVIALEERAFLLFQPGGLVLVVSR